MATQAPVWALAAQAVPVAGDDPHLADGVHLRVSPTPMVGLPTAPFDVYRRNLGPGGKHTTLRTDVTWIDSRGQVLQPPFQVSPANPVIGYLPSTSTATCCWVRVHATPTTVTIGGGGGGAVIDKPPIGTIDRPPIGTIDKPPIGTIDKPPIGTIDRPPIGTTGQPDLRPPFTRDPRILGRGTTRLPDPRVPTVREVDIRSPDARLPELRLPELRLPDLTLPGFGRRITLALRVEAIANTGDGAVELARRSRAPYDLGVSHIHQVRVVGSGMVHGLQWLDAWAVRDIGKRPWRRLGLPVPAAPRYLGEPDAVAKAAQRIAAGAPKAFGLHERPEASGPATATPIAIASRGPWETARVAAATDGAAPNLKTMLHAVLASPRPEQHTTVQESHDATSHPDGAALTLPTEAILFQASADAGVARWLGFMDVDQTEAGAPGDLVIYVLRAPFALDAARWFTALGVTLPEGVQSTNPELLGTDLMVVAACTLGAPPDAPRAPSVGPIDPGKWLPGQGAEGPARGVRYPLTDLARGASVGIARVLGGITTAVNKALPVAAGSPRRALLSPSPPADPSGVALADVDVLGVSEERAPTDAYSCRAAQIDLFGRWSPWGAADVAALPRPTPPQAMVEGSYAPAAVPDPLHDGLLAGTLTARLALPPPGTLPTGALPLQGAQLQVEVRGAAAGAPWTPHADTQLLGPFPASPTWTGAGPALARCATGTARMRARWRDTANTHGPWGPWVSVGVFDPRPPPDVVLPATLEYGSRPDALGLSRIVLTWPSHPSHAGYRVFYADETRLRRVLTGLTTNPADPAPERSEELLGRKADVDRAQFELLTGEPLPVLPGLQRFSFEVSGALDVLCFFRIVAVGASGAPAPFPSSPMVSRGVPNAYAPAQPLLERLGQPEVDGDDVRVALRVQVPKGGPQPRRVRVRRSRRVATDADLMPVSLELDLPEDAGHVIDLSDTGPLPGLGTTMTAWCRYSWVVEVQAPPQPGTETLDRVVAGAWSKPSNPVHAVVLGPAEAPADDLQVQRLGNGETQVRWRHSSPLVGGDLGSFVFDVYRQSPGDRTRLVSSLPAQAPPALGGRVAGGTFTVTDPESPPPGTRYRVVLLDPIGRKGTPALSEPLT